MRIRTIKPAFWHDSILARLPEATRLFYVGLWMVADDAGWFRWDPPEIANDLYGYDRRDRREAKVKTMMAQLVEAGRVGVLECAHAFIPTLVAHQHLSGLTKQVKTVENEHLRRCVSRQSPQTPAGILGDPQSPASVRLGLVSPVKEGNGFAQPREMSQKEREEEARRLGVKL